MTQLCKNVRISEKYKSHIYGGELLKNFYIKVAVLVCLVPIITSCESFSPIILGKPTDSSEINKWSPPTEKEFFQRRKKQKILDDLEKNLEERFLLQENLDDEERALLASLRITKKQLSSIEPAVQKKIDNFKSYFKEIQTQLANLEKMGTDINTGISEYKESLIPKVSKSDHYVSAIRWFRKGNYPKSVDEFNKMLKQNPPSFILDNIYFGIGTAFYKMEKWDSAIKFYNKVISDYPMGNKWPVSHIMLGLIYNRRDETSRALYILESSLQKHLPDSTRKIIERLLKSTKNQEADIKG